MPSREELFEKLLTYLEAHQPLPEFLGEAPNQPQAFDPYQMVGEWIALRHEVKQQGKLLLSAQEALQHSIASLQADKDQLQLRLEESQKQATIQFAAEFAAQKRQLDQTQKGLLKDLLEIVDALDHACASWQGDDLESQAPAPPVSFWQRIAQWFASLDSSSPAPPSPVSLTEVLKSNQQGIELIRRSLLDVLRQRHVVPMNAQGKPFDATCMYAVGRQETDEMPENRVYQEAVPGYLWGDQVLREAQVIVAVRKA